MGFTVDIWTLALPHLDAAMPLETQPACGEIVARRLRFLAGRPLTFEADAPKAVELTAFHQPRRARFTVSLLNFQEKLPNIPAGRVRVTLHAGRRRVRRVARLPDGRRLAFRSADDAVTFTVPCLDTFAMVAVEYACSGAFSTPAEKATQPEERT